ncbi:hypothetical protein GCM10009839_11960 [Catenulispora yoronensis]|uniref:Uncharacterized protein n=1 Tax=Catenulispora yoronensis TaxID=450799 RepID=A0ABP5F5I8_9ACTN
MGAAVPFVVVFGSEFLVGLRQTPDVRDGYRPSWSLACAIAAVSAGVFYGALVAARRSPGRGIAKARRRQGYRRQYDAQAEAYWEDLRTRYFGPKRVPLAFVVTPALWLLPITFTASDLGPPDPVTGQAPVYVGNLVAGFALAVAPVLVWSLAGRTVTAMCLGAWSAYAGWTEAGHPFAGGVAGFVGLAATLVVLVATVVVRRRRPARS